MRLQVGLLGSSVCVYESIDNFVMQCDDEAYHAGRAAQYSCVCVYESIDNLVMQCNETAGRAAR